MKREQYEYKKGIKWALLGMVLTFLLIALLLLDFQKQLSLEVERQTGIHLKEIALQVGETIKVEMESCVHEVKHMAAVMETIEQPLDERIIPILNEGALSSNLSRLAVVTRDGDVYNSSDIVAKAFDYRYIEDVFQGKSGISDVFTSSVTQEQVLSIYSPIYRDGEIVAGIFGTIVIEELAEIVSFSGFDGEGYSYLMQSNGSTIMWTEHRNKITKNVNFYDFFNELGKETTLTGNEFRQQVSKGESGYITYTVSDMTRRAYYYPVGFKNWYVLSIVPQEVMESYGAKFYIYALELTMKVLIISAIVILLIIRWMRANRKRLEQAHYHTVSANKKYEIAMRSAKVQMFEYDVKKDCMINLTEEIKMLLQGREVDVVQSASSFACDVFSEESLQKLKWVVEEGQDTDYDLELLKKDGGWVRIAVSVIQQMEGTHLIGTVEDITKLKEIQAQFSREEEYLIDALEQSLSGFSVDLEDKRLLSVYKGGMRMANQSHSLLDDQWMEGICRRVHPDYQTKIGNLFREEDLNRLYSRGIKELVENFMIQVSEDQGYIWAAATIRFLTDPSNGHPIMFAFIKDVDDKKKRELEIEYHSERDGLTGLYNRRAFIRKVDSMLTSLGDGGCSALLMMDLDGFKNVNDEYGHLAGDHLLQSIAGLLSDSVGGEHCVGRLGGDEFVIFIHNAVSKDQVAAIAEEICSKVEKYSIEEYDIGIFTISIGVAFAGEKDTFDGMYLKADRALYRAKREGKNRVCKSDEEEVATLP